MTTVLAFIAAPTGIAAYQLIGRELDDALRRLGLATVLGESTATIEKALLVQGCGVADAACETLDARVATIAGCDLLVAVLDGAHPDVLIDIGLAYARGTDCYGLHLDGAAPDGLHVGMLDGLVRSIPELVSLLRGHLRLDPVHDDPQPAAAAPAASI
jgi:nucleoside 2-deoxyribosyltransferase